MPIQHTVVFRLRHQHDDPAVDRFLTDASRILAGIPGVSDFEVHRQVSDQSDLHWQFSMIFADQAAYDRYNTHPAHQAFVAERWAHEVAAFQEYDFTAR